MILRLFLAMVLALSLAVNLILFLALVGFSNSLSTSGSTLNEKHYAGPATATDKIAVVRIDGVLMDGLNGFAQKQIEAAALDSGVKAVVLRINSPGGTITASDDLHRRITELRDGNPEKKTAAKPLVVSMASIAASGGYYLAMPAPTLVAERTTITGSIGVYAALPNAVELSKKVGFSMNVIKAGQVKDSGSPFHEMTEHERQLWQDMVDQSYLQFIQVVEQGRPQLKGKLQEDIVIDVTRPIRDAKAASHHVQYRRYRADGGIFTAAEAKQFGLVDEIGYLNDAIKLARQAAHLGDNSRVVTYERPITLLGSLLGVKAGPPETVLDPSRLAAGAVPRLWYLSPQADLAGIFAAMGHGVHGD
jgi:protease-4